MASTITQFVTENGVYTFSNLSKWSDNFGSLRNSMTQLPGQDGSIDNYGWSRLPKQQGEVKISLALFANNDAEAAANFDAVREMVSWGKGRLIMQPVNGGAERFCYARLVNVPRAMNINSHADYLQRVELTFAADYPYWLEPGSYGASFWNAATWGSDNWDNSSIYPLATNSNVTSIPYVYSGNAPVPAAFRFVHQGAEPSAGIEVKRTTPNGVVLDRFIYRGQIDNNNVLLVDGWNWSVTLNGRDAYNDYFESARLRLFSIDPGSQVISIRNLGFDASGSNHFQGGNVRIFNHIAWN